MAVTCYSSHRRLARWHLPSVPCFRLTLNSGCSPGLPPAKPRLPRPSSTALSADGRLLRAHVSAAPSACLYPLGHVHCPLLFLWVVPSELQPWRMHLQGTRPSPEWTQGRRLAVDPALSCQVSRSVGLPHQCLGVWGPLSPASCPLLSSPAQKTSLLTPVHLGLIPSSCPDETQPHQGWPLWLNPAPGLSPM